MWTKDQKTRVRELVCTLREELSQAGFRIRPINNVKFTSRVKYLGKCSRKAYREGVTIYLNSLILSGEVMKPVILHELCHAMYGTVGHGEAWQKFAEAVGNIYGVRITQFLPRADYIQLNPESAYKYKAVCPKCNRYWGYYRKGKVVKQILQGKNITCPYCQTKLNVKTY